MLFLDFLMVFRLFVKRTGSGIFRFLSVIENSYNLFILAIINFSIKRCVYIIIFHLGIVKCNKFCKYNSEIAVGLYLMHYNFGA